MTITLPRIVIGNKKAKTVRRRVAPRPAQTMQRRPAPAQAAPRVIQRTANPNQTRVASRPQSQQRRPPRPAAPPEPPPPIIGRDGREILPSPKWTPIPFQNKEGLAALHSAAEYATEARMEQPVIRLGGMRYSAFMNPGVMSRRYQRHNQFFGGVGGVKVKAIMTLLIAGLTTAAWFGVYLGTVDQTGRTIENNPIFEASLSAVVAVGFTALIAVGFWLSHQFKASYLQVRVFERAVETEEWNTTGELRLYVPRLAFIDSAKKGDYFSGPTRQSGAQHGSVHVDLPLGQRIVDMKSYADIYDLEPSVSTFTEVPQRQTYQFLQECVDAGTLARFAGKSKLGKLLSENAAWIVTGVFGILTFFMVMGGAQPQ